MKRLLLRNPQWMGGAKKVQGRLERKTTPEPAVNECAIEEKNADAENFGVAFIIAECSIRHDETLSQGSC